MGMTRVGVKIAPLAAPDETVELPMLLAPVRSTPSSPKPSGRRWASSPCGGRSSRSPTAPGSRGSWGECRFEIAGRTAVSPAVLGEGDDAPLLGMVRLETLGLMIDPLSRRVQPMRVLPLRACVA
ncbi:MAG: hypothetical protein KIT14_00575 [bacterium]|nr:hypothetical protein [bacterium]